MRRKLGRGGEGHPSSSKAPSNVYVLTTAKQKASSRVQAKDLTEPARAGSARVSAGRARQRRARAPNRRGYKTTHRRLCGPRAWRHSSPASRPSAWGSPWLRGARQRRQPASSVTVGHAGPKSEWTRGAAKQRNSAARLHLRFRAAPRGGAARRVWFPQQRAAAGAARGMRRGAAAAGGRVWWRCAGGGLSRAHPCWPA